MYARLTSVHTVTVTRCTIHWWPGECSHVFSQQSTVDCGITLRTQRLNTLSRDSMFKLSVPSAGTRRSGDPSFPRWNIAPTTFVTDPRLCIAKFVVCMSSVKVTESFSMASVHGISPCCVRRSTSVTLKSSVSSGKRGCTL